MLKKAIFQIKFSFNDQDFYFILIYIQSHEFVSRAASRRHKSVSANTKLSRCTRQQQTKRKLPSERKAEENRREEEGKKRT